jgi:hypothetical protein
MCEQFMEEDTEESADDLRGDKRDCAGGGDSGEGV